MWKKTLAMAVVAPAMLLSMAAPPALAAPGDPVSTNLALASAGATVTSSGDESVGSNGPDLAIDGGDTTRWSSEHSDTAQLTVKLAKPAAIDKIVIKWEKACAAQYKLQVSTDGVSFVDATDVISRANCAPETPDTQTIKSSLAGTKYQFVRMQGIARTPIAGTKWGISLFEMEVWGVPAAPAQNIALASAGATVSASGQEVAGQWGPALVIDGDTDSTKPNAQQSRWSSNTADSANITVKLAAPTVIDHVAIVWEKACAAKYKLQVSTDGITFVDATDVIAPTCNTRDVQKLKAGVAANAYQYVRMQGIERTLIGGQKYGISLWEFEVWDGEEVATPAPVSEPVNLIPLPVNMETPDEAPFKLGAGSRIVANNAVTAKSASFLAELFRTSTGLALPVVNGSTGDADDIVLLQTPGDIPNLGAQLQAEAYTLSVDALTGAKITAATDDGIFNGVQTLRQLFPAFIESKTKVNATWTAPAVEISDAPRFDKRGMMLDVAREFKNPDEVKVIIDSLASYKISTLHMHLADDQGWRIEITNEGKVAGDDIDYNQLTEISGKGGMTQFNRTYMDLLGNTGFYTQAEYKDLVAYAADRHIEIIPEIDVPGHTSAILHAIPQLNTAGTKPNVDEWGVVPEDGTGNVGTSTLDVAAPQTWTFLEHVFGQIAEMTTSEYIHIGGDESHVTGHDNYVEFITKAVKLIHDLDKKPIGWNEVAIGGLEAGDGIQYWTGGTADTLRAIKDKGAKLMVSNGSTAYLDMKYNAKTPIGLTWAGMGDFPKYYDWNPAAVVKDGTTNLPDSAILGVEAPQWSETIRGGKQTEFMVFPRVISFAEVGWTPQAKRNVNDFKVRMASMGSRLLAADTNFYDGNQAKWTPAMAGLPVAVSPGKSLKLDVGQLAAPGTKASADGATIAVDAVDDADGVSASSILGNLGVSVNWGDGSAATPATFTANTARNHMSAGSLYQLQGTHSYASAGTFTGTLTASNGTTAQFTVVVAAGTADPKLPYVWDSTQTPTLSTTAATVRAGYRALTTVTGFVPGEYVTLNLGGNKVGTVLPDAEGKVTLQMPVYPSTYGGKNTLTATQGERTASTTLNVESNMVPLANKITQSEIKIASVSSEELTGETAPNGPAAALLDGKKETFWHTKWSSPAGNFPHSVVFDLGKNYDVTGFEYTQRQSNTNGKFKDYELYVSENTTDFGTKVASGSFLDVSRPQVIDIAGNKVGRYVKLVGLNSIEGNNFGGGAEVNIGGVLPGTTEPTTDPTTEPTTEPTVTASPSVEPTVTASPSVEPTVTASPSVEPTVTASPSVEPTATTDPTTDPTADPTVTASPSVEPTATTVPTTTTEPTVDPSTPADGAPTAVLSNASVAPGEELTITGSNFKPGSTATFTLHSDPIVLGTAIANSEGIVSLKVTLPSTVTPGVHTVIITGLGSNGEAAEASVKLTVVAAASSTSSTQAGNSNNDDLASTGAGTTPFLLGGLLLVVAGAFTLISRRKRKSSHA
ncbi:family 20 glycosylhydrolase [Arthrobacter psychrochitiniphilus]|uniref:family 20 glycosylhydrolase n=1 Tax=Arthrobacter psychrochitiniphilus TaxID=291045 RepID=UPI00211C5887|nr:family 20 glycosylhydrolase [Arthrobacter psychrochitiniphilus]